MAKRQDSSLLALIQIAHALPSERDSIDFGRSFDSDLTRPLLEDPDLGIDLLRYGTPLGITTRWAGKRTNAWSNAHKMLVQA
jgi:hypothetical protein